MTHTELKRQPTAAMLVIGDEILSGRTRDANAYYLAAELMRYGIDLKEIRVIGDDADVIVTALRDLSAAFDYLFTSGGIGPTHDDITADCVAVAFDRGIDIRADARALMAAYYPNGTADLTPARLRMARVPDGATLIENPVSGAPGFIVQNTYVMAGIPNVFCAMLDTLLPSLKAGQPMQSKTLTAYLPESSIAESLGQIAAVYPNVSIGSYPFFKDGKYGANLVVRGLNAKELSKVVLDIKNALDL